MRARLLWLVLAIGGLSVVAPAQADDSTAARSRAVAVQLRSLRMVNYFPAKHAWPAMWTHWEEATVRRDFARIAGLRANAVRLTLFPSVTGFPYASGRARVRLERALELAQAHGLRVGLTLFDWWSRYRDVRGSETWLTSILGDHRGDTRIAFVELKDEIPVDDARASRWARSMLPFARTMLAGIPVTISIADSAGPGGLRRLSRALGRAQPDFYTYDFFHAGAGWLAASVLAAARRAASPRPLFVGSTGFSRDASSGQVSGLARDRGSLSAYQAQYLRTVELATQTLGLGTAAPWTMNAFTADAIPGGRVSRLEYAFGLGAESRRAIRGIFAGVPIGLGFNRGFEVAASHGALPALWRRDHAADGEFGIDSSVHHRGSRSARLGHTRGSPSFFISPVAAAVIPGRQCFLTAWARGEDATGISVVSIAWFDASSRWLSQTDSTAVPPGTTGWRKLEAAGDVPPGAAFVQLHLRSSDNAGRVWFDDVAFSCAPHG